MKTRTSVAAARWFFKRNLSTTATISIPHRNSSLHHLVRRSHYTYSSPGTFHDHDHDHAHAHAHPDDHDMGNDPVRNFHHRGYTVGIGGPVGSGKTALVLALTRILQQHIPLGVVTNDIFTQEDAEFLTRHRALPSHLIRAVETGGCPHAAIREDISANLSAAEELTKLLLLQSPHPEPFVEGTANAVAAVAASADAAPDHHQRRPAIPMILCESGGDNLAANFSRELADVTLYVIDVAGGDKVPRKGGPGITQSDLLIINKIDLAEAVGADLDVMRRDANLMRRRQHGRQEDESSGPTIFASVKHGVGVSDIQNFIMDHYARATKVSTSVSP